MTSERPALDVRVTDAPERSRYVVAVNGSDAGRLEYLLRPDRVVFTHAEVDPRWEGLGVGSQLAKVALDDVVARGLLITPLCPFIVAYIHHHPEYVESVDPAHRGEYTADENNEGVS